MPASIGKYLTSLGVWGWLVYGINLFSMVNLGFNLTDNPIFVIPTWGWLIFLIVGLIIAPFFAFHKIQTKLDRIENARPNMVLVKTENVHGDVITRRAGSVVARERPWFARVHIANAPESPLQAVDAIIAAHITFRDSSGQECFTMIGRWSETLEIAQGGQPTEIDQPTIPPTGRPYILDIGLKYHEEDEFYGYNNETPRKDTVGFRDKDRMLSVGTYSVEVRLRGKGVDKAFSFTLKNKGKDNEVELKAIA